MLDVLLDDTGDLDLTQDGDIQFGTSVAQSILSRLKWIKGEWRLGPDLGFPWYEKVFVKNPDVSSIKQSIRETILSVDGVKSCNITNVRYDQTKRTIRFKYEVEADGESMKGEVSLNG